MTTSPPPCIVLAGGLGTRLRGVVADRPKCLAPVGSRTFLEIQLDALRAQGVRDLILSLGYRAEQVVDWLRTYPARQSVRTVVEPAPLGTGGAIAHVMDSLSMQVALVANGDTFLDGSLRAMLTPLRADGSEWLRMALVEVPDRTRFGGVTVDSAGQVTGFVPKGSGSPGAINAGLYHLSRQALSGASGAFSIESDVLPGLVAAGRVFGVALDGGFTDIGVPEDYADFCVRHG